MEVNDEIEDGLEDDGKSEDAVIEDTSEVS